MRRFSPNEDGQYDTETDNIGVNARLRWALFSGADFHAVWTRGWLHPSEADRLSDGAPINSEALVKLRWTFRM